MHWIGGNNQYGKAPPKKSKFQKRKAMIEFLKSKQQAEVVQLEEFK